MARRLRGVDDRSVRRWRLENSRRALSITFSRLPCYFHDRQYSGYRNFLNWGWKTEFVSLERMPKSFRARLIKHTSGQSFVSGERFALNRAKPSSTVVSFDIEDWHLQRFTKLGVGYSADYYSWMQAWNMFDFDGHAEWNTFMNFKSIKRFTKSEMSV